MKYVFSTTLALALLTSAPALADGRIDVMTQNQYLGADLTPIVAAGAADPFDPFVFNEAVVAALEEVAANDFPTRAELLAKLIANRLPDLVGLQEVFTFGCVDPPFEPPFDFLSASPFFLPDTPPNKGCDDPDIRNAFNDHLALTLAALVALDEPYDAVASVQNFDTRTVTLPPPPLPPETPFPSGVPFVINGWLAVANMIDHDVILAPSDDASLVVPVPYSEFCERRSADGGPGCNYQVVADAHLPGGQVLKIERGWVGVDARIDDKDYRFVNTHLEVQVPDPTNPLSPVVQAFQSAELIATLGASTPLDKSLIVVGDINSSSEDPFIPVPPETLPPPFQDGIIPPYTQFVGSGYTDAWTVTGDIPGYSCCQESDLSNHSSILDERIDVIFSLDPEAWLNKAKKKRVLGSKVPDKSAPDGLWPSDHGSVAAQLEFE